MPPVRRLTAILAADVAGYSRLMGADEEGTHERLKAHLRELIEPKIAEQRDRIVKNTGDGFLAEFASVVDAVRCAVDLQRGMAERNAGTPPEEQRIEFRIGINLGDVIAEEHDIFGDGVNIAARLEGLGEPGGICISGTVHDQVRDKLAYRFEDRGEQRLKNICWPVRVYGLHPGILADPAANKSARASSISSPIVAPRLSIVVLPFANLSNDPEQGYFADAITDDLTTDLSRITDIFVISRGTAFTYKEKQIGAKEVGRELGVRYVLEGSIRPAGNQLRVNTELIDTETAQQLWAERFDSTSGNLIEIQDEITCRIASALGAQLVQAESVRAKRERPNNPDAADLAMRARALLCQLETPTRNAEARRLFEEALAVEPTNVSALVGLARTYMSDRGNSWFTEPAARVIAAATDAINRAIAIDPRNALAYLVKARALTYNEAYDYRGQLGDAIAAAEKAIALDRNLAEAYAWLGRLYTKAGNPERTASLVQRAIHLSPNDPYLDHWLFQIGVAELQMGHPAGAIETFRRSLVLNSERWNSWAGLTAAYIAAGQQQKASGSLAEVRKRAVGWARAHLPHTSEEHLLSIRVEIELLQRGRWPYNPDGLHEPKLYGALAEFQRDENIPPTGAADATTLARLGIFL